MEHNLEQYCRESGESFETMPDVHPPACMNSIRGRFGMLGQRWILQTQCERVQEEEITPRDERIRLLTAESAQWQAQAANSMTKAESSETLLRELSRQLDSQASQSAERVRELEERVEHLNLTLREAKRLCCSMSTSLCWRLTWPLRVLRDAGARTLNKLHRRSDSPLKSVPGPSMTADPSLLVNALYKASFGRLADPQGLAHHIWQLQSEVSPEDLAEELVASAEFQTRHGPSQTVDKKYLTALYRAGLGRPA